MQDVFKDDVLKTTTPVFILGSGRSGTFQMTKLLESIDDIEAHHEYLFENVLKTAVLYRMKLVSRARVLSLLKETYGAAIHYSDKKYWVDSSNALPWLIDCLYELFPNAVFIHLLRDGRIVVSSFFNKFPSIMYEDGCVDVLSKWISDPKSHIEPPAEKKYWRPLPIKNEPFFDEFSKFNRFQRLCYYWQDINYKIKESLITVPVQQKYVFYLERLVKDAEDLKKFLAIFEIVYEQKFLESLKRPVNVHIPKNFPFSLKQQNSFNAIAGGAMKEFGYNNSKEYGVEY